MRLCIPTETNEGIRAKVCSHFGSAPYFTIYDSQTGTYETLDNSNQDHIHGACHPMALLAGKNIQAVVCVGMGARAVQSFRNAGIRTYRATADTVEQIVGECEKNRLEEITVENACSQHRCRS